MSTNSLKVFHDSALAPLLVQLGKDLSVPLGDPFTPEVIVVPNSDMARYLKRELSKTLGASGFDDGIVSNISFIYPRQLINASSQSPLNSFSSPWDAEQLTWMIVDTLLLNKNRIKAPGFDTAPLSVARRIASLYDHYISHRPEMLNHWARGGIDDGTSIEERPNDVKKDQQWQQKLFAELSETSKIKDLDSARAINNLDDFKKALNSKSVLNLPARISVFGISTLSRGARQVLEAISDVSEVTLYLVYFAGDKWPNATPTSTVIRKDFDSGPTHYLSRRWGAQIIESAAVLRNWPKSFLSSRSTKETLLGSIQSGIANDAQPPLINLSKDDLEKIKHASDGTIQIHACYGLARQAEALRDSILHLLNEDPTLRLRDIAILCGDVQASAPILNAVLAPNKTDSVNLPKLTINVVNDSLNTQDQVVEALLALLHLFTSRCSPSDVLDVAQLEPIGRTFGFDDEAIELISTWSEQLVIRYGLNDNHRQAHGMKDALPIGTWAQALDRLFTGVAVPGEVDRLGPGGVVPYDGISGSDLSTAGAVSEFIARVENFAFGFVPMSIAEWCKTLLEIINQFISVGKSDTEQLKLIKLTSKINQMGQNAANVTDATAIEKFSVSELTQMFKESLADGFGMFSSKFEEITVSGFKNLAHIPFRVLCIFGADEQAFAGSHSDGDDVLSNNPCIGEPIYSLDGRQNLLNAVMSASDNLIITCSGSDISNNKELPLAVPVQELLELANQYIYKKIDNSYGSQTILARHPRQNFDQEVLTPDLVFKHKPFTFDQQSKAAYEVLRTEKKQEQEKKLTASKEKVKNAEKKHEQIDLEGLIDGEKKHEQIDLKGLIDVVTNPTEYFVKSILKARIPKMPSDSENPESTIQGNGILNLTIDGLAEAGEGRQLLDQIVKSDRDFKSIASAWAALRPISGQLPPGKLGEWIIGEIKTEICKMIGLLPEDLQSLSGGIDTDCEVIFNDTPTVLRITNLRKNEFVRVLYKRFSDSLELGPWIELAILTIADQNGRRFEAHLVTRGPDKKPTPVYKHFAIKGETDLDRKQNAQKVLECVKGMYQAASAGPVPFFENASREIRASRRVAGTDKQKKIKQAAESLKNKDLKYSSELRYIFGDKEPEEILNEPALSKDYERLGHKVPVDEDEETSRAELFADFVYKVLEETREMLKDNTVKSGKDSGRKNDEASSNE